MTDAKSQQLQCGEDLDDALEHAPIALLLWAVAGPALKTIFNNAVSKVIVI